MRVLLRALSVLAVSVAWATDYTWNGSTGTFQADANWSPTGVPGIADQAKFTTAGTYGVTLAGDATNRLATVGASGGTTATFDLAGYTWQMTNNLAFANTGTARFGGGTLKVGYYNQANNTSVSPGANQKLVLDSGTGFFMGNLNTSSGGAIEVNGGDYVLSWAMGLNPPAAGGASFRMTGGTFTMTNNDNLARCSLWNGSRMLLEGGTLSIRYQVDIQGTLGAPAVIDIHTNGTLLQNPGIGFNVARTAGGLGIVNIRGGSLILSNSNCNVANAAATSLITTGLVNLVDGRLIAGNLTFGYTSNGVAIVQQSGGSLHVTGETYLGKERNTKGVLSQSGGDAWYSQFYVGGFSGGLGEVNLSGGRLAVVANASAVGKIAGSAGRFLQSGGAMIISNSLSAGNAAGAFGVITNTGGSFWMNGALYLGNSGAGAVGKAYFSGPSNTVPSGIVVGHSTNDTGELTLAGGALTSLNGALTVGNLARSSGSALISGGANVFKGLTVGSSGTGTLSITGGQLTMTNGATLVVGSSPGSAGTVTISGGTNFLNGAGSTVGNYGYGLCRITGGYTYTTNRWVVGGASNGVGRLELSGGILSAPIIDGRDMTLTNGNPGGYSEVLFDGGTLHHSVDNEWWMPSGFVSTFGKATLTDRGAVIDSNGGVLAISQALSNEVGFAGSFTKKGAGKLTLTSWYNAFTGRVTVREGELAVAVSGAISLTGGVVIDPGAILNLASAGAVRGTVTASGSSSRIDGALTLKSGSVLTNGVGATLGGCGVVTGSVVFATGSVYGRDKAAGSGALQVTGDAVIRDGVTVALTGYTPDDLAAGIPLVTAVSSGTIQTAGRLPVTLDGASHSYWWAKAEAGGKTLTARVISFGTLIAVK